MQTAKRLFLLSLVFAIGCSTAVVNMDDDASVTKSDTTPAKSDVSNPQSADSSTSQGVDASSTEKVPEQTSCVSITIYHDADGDGYGDNATAILHCKEQPIASDWTTDGGDCNDNAPNVFPNIFEILKDSIDNDCDGMTDNIEPYSCSNCKGGSHCIDPDNDGLGFCEMNSCDAVVCDKIDGICNNKNLCEQWCNFCILTVEDCIDTNGNGLGDMCKPK